MLNWGILGAGWISNTFVSDFYKVENACIKAVAARDLQRAQSFAKKHNIPLAYGNYAEMLQNPAIDVVYIGTTHNFHYEHVMMCLQAGKHVLCEKPITINARQFQELTQEAKKRHLFLMEAMWTVFFPVIDQAKKWIKAGKIGDITFIEASLGWRLDMNPERRNANIKLGAGAILDIGTYPLHFGYIFAQSDVKQSSIMAHQLPSGVDLTESIQVEYENGILAQYGSSVEVNMTNVATITGTEGCLVFNDFHSPRKVSLIKEGKVVETFEDNRDTAGYNYEAQETTDCIIKGQLESKLMPHSTSSRILSLMDNLRSKIHLQYEADRY